ncbi:hypothetical protein VCHC61A2_2982 [Vibrio cholerae HC-61A2]|nr:hypothetical protein VCCP103811_3244 [Vibrio cholerae CP1038(11)]EKL12039.1 hypothetical protein VCHC59A1_2398 [Vibrio cholerae HC-59A1]EKL20462.1 hypothetical protein VCHC61A2_2982 [Vibrio cholerae HC-61A2]EKL99218.1 hypothetical protein VCHC55B2_2549 [Vibrio cholerae HC-55B2]KKP18720.1 hypothetical protein VS85_01072 [Vibrio cholerae]
MPLTCRFGYPVQLFTKAQCCISNFRATFYSTHFAHMA